MDKRKRIRNASSLDNGIIYYSSKIPWVGIKTYYDENDEIECEYVSRFEEMLKTYHEAIKSNIGRYFIIIHLLVVFSGYALYLLTNNIAIWLLSLLIIFYGIHERIFYMFISLIDFKTAKGKKRPLARFHAAEHQSINAYNKKGRIPTYTEVANESRFSRYCGSMIVFNSTFLNIIKCIIFYVFAANALNIFEKIKIFLTSMEVTTGYYVAMVSIIVLIVTIVAMLYIIIKTTIVDYAPLQFMEALYTEKPSDKEIRLALKGLENYEQMEKAIDEICHAYVVDMRNGVIIEITEKGEV